MISSESDHQDGQTSESSPLLAGTSSPPRRPASPTPSLTPKSHPKLFMVATICIALAFFVEVGDYMLRAPLMRILEEIICRSYYESTTPVRIDLSIPIPEGECKIPFVQSKLAMLRGWDTTFSCIPSILAAVPYGMVADRYGRKLVLLLSLLGVVLGLLWIMVVSKLKKVPSSVVFGRRYGPDMWGQFIIKTFWI
jgi:MFS family permease